MADVEFYGEKFALNASVSEFALMEFALAAEDGEDGDTKQGLASILRLIKECVAPEGWPRFRALARENRAGVADLLPVLQATFEQVAERPTGAPSVSSDGRDGTPPKSESSSEELVASAFPGRPDKQVAALQAVRSA